VIKKTGVDRLEILPCGRIPYNPAELLTTPYLKELIDDMAGGRDLVLIDSPPVLPVADTQTISPAVDGVLLILDASRTKRSAALEAVRELSQVGANVIGVVINRVEQASPYYDRAGYYTAYRAEGREEKADAGDARREPRIKAKR
jgi:capsular exopolysaccharide synthesis family protein